MSVYLSAVKYGHCPVGGAKIQALCWGQFRLNQHENAPMCLGGRRCCPAAAAPLGQWGVKSHPWAGGRRGEALARVWRCWRVSLVAACGAVTSLLAQHQGTPSRTGLGGVERHLSCCLLQLFGLSSAQLLPGSPLPWMLKHPHPSGCLQHLWFALSLPFDGAHGRCVGTGSPQSGSLWGSPGGDHPA